MKEAAHILIVDPNTESLDRTRSVLSGMGSKISTASSMADALEIAAEVHPGLILTEMEFQEATVHEYIDALGIWLPDAVLIGYTFNPSGYRSGGRFLDILEKPLPDESLLANVMRGVEFYRELRETRDLEKLEKEQFRHRLEWLLWRRTRETRRMIDYGLQLVTNMRHAISQGEGVGSLVTHAEFLQIMPKDAEGNFIVPADMVQSLGANAKAVRSWISSLEQFSSIENATYERQNLNAQIVSASIEKAVLAVEKFRCVGGHTVHREKINFEGSVAGNVSALEMTIRELLTNAFKYSPKGSIVNIIELRGGQSVSLAVINDVRSDMKNIELSTEAFMPFARTSNVYNDEFLDEELSLGIGLPVIQDAMQQNGGAIFLREINDHSHKESRPRILAEIVMGARLAENK